MKLLFLDEAGNHALDRSDLDYPVFVLGGVIGDRDYYLEELEPRVRRLKRELLGNELLILHTRDIIRGKQGFEVLNDPLRRWAFYEALNALMRNAEYVVVSWRLLSIGASVAGRLPPGDAGPAGPAQVTSEE